MANLTLDICDHEHMSCHVCMQSFINIGMLFRGRGEGLACMMVEYCRGDGWSF